MRTDDEVERTLIAVVVSARQERAYITSGAFLPVGYAAMGEDGVVTQPQDFAKGRLLSLA